MSSREVRRVLACSIIFPVFALVRIGHASAVGTFGTPLTSCPAEEIVSLKLSSGWFCASASFSYGTSRFSRKSNGPRSPLFERTCGCSNEMSKHSAWACCLSCTRLGADAVGWVRREQARWAKWVLEGKGRRDVAVRVARTGGR